MNAIFDAWSNLKIVWRRPHHMATRIGTDPLRTSRKANLRYCMEIPSIRTLEGMPQSELPVNNSPSQVQNTRASAAPRGKPNTSIKISTIFGLLVSAADCETCAATRFRNALSCRRSGELQRSLTSEVESAGMSFAIARCIEFKIWSRP